MCGNTPSPATLMNDIASGSSGDWAGGGGKARTPSLGESCDHQPIHSLGPFTFPFSTLNNKVNVLILAGKAASSMRVGTLRRFSGAMCRGRHV